MKEPRYSAGLFEIHMYLYTFISLQPNLINICEKLKATTNEKRFLKNVKLF